MLRLNKKSSNYIKDLYMTNKEWIKVTVLTACISHQKEWFLKWWGLPLDAIRSKIYGSIKVLKKRRRMKEFSKFKKLKHLLKILLNDNNKTIILNNYNLI